MIALCNNLLAKVTMVEVLNTGKLPTIAGSIVTENNIRHYIKTMAPRISAIV